jgi:hypothetical protein
MDLITSLGTVIAAAATAVGTHFVAHDLYKGAPTHARRLLDHAVKLLPEADRARYQEEWLAHLQDCEGVLCKFRHAFECWLVAHKLRRIIERRELHAPNGIEFVITAKSRGKTTVSMDFFTALPFLMVMRAVGARDRTSSPEEFVPSQEIIDLLKHPAVDRKRVLEIQTALEAVNLSDLASFRAQVVDRFGRVMTKQVVGKWLEENDVSVEDVSVE